MTELPKEWVWDIKREQYFHKSLIDPDTGRKRKTRKIDINEETPSKNMSERD